jgi:hypothetical protein
VRAVARLRCFEVCPFHHDRGALTNRFGWI